MLLQRVRKEAAPHPPGVRRRGECRPELCWVLGGVRPLLAKHTVLVLGAGASMPFGFPSGEKLVSRILTILEDEAPKAPLQLIRRALGSDQLQVPLGKTPRAPELGDPVASFREGLFYSGRQSIDMFLEHNPEFLTIGKMAIAAALVPLENPDRLFSAGSNWYKTLFNYLNTRFEEFAKNPLAILTYNYDRSLEQFLITALRYSYQGMKTERARCWEQLSALPIVHLHGALGRLSQGEPGAPGEHERDYRPQLTNRDLMVCAQTIQVISEGGSSQPEYQAAHDHLRAAEVICFLGFGWDRTNLARLQVNTSENWQPERARYGTAYGKGDAEREAIMQHFSPVGGIDLGNRAQDIDAFLRDFPVLA
jgi:hypothetical protein